jgi:allantoin racemase
MRILWQSFVDENLNAPYLERLRKYLAEIASPGTTVDVIGLTPPARDFGRLQEVRCGVAAIRNAIQAEKEGYDAFVIGHFQEPLLYEARASVGIPVIGLGESTLLWSQQLGRRFALISLDDAFEVIHLEQVDRYNLGDSLVAVTALNLRVEDFSAAFAGDRVAYDNLVNAFRTSVAPLVEQGANLLIPAGNLFGLLTAQEKNFTVGHAPVVPCTPIALGWAELAAKLAARNGLLPSQGPSFKRAGSQSVEDFLALLSHDDS